MFERLRDVPFTVSHGNYGYLRACPFRRVYRYKAHADFWSVWGL